MRVGADDFLARVTGLYEAPVAPGRKGTIAISCKSVATARVTPKDHSGDNALLFRAVKYGNNHHKIKYSVLISAVAQAAFHAQLSTIVKTNADRRARGSATPANKRNTTKGKKAI